MRKIFLFFLLAINFLFAENWAEQTLASMTLQEKIGQLFMIDMRPQIANEKTRLEEFFCIDVPYDTAKDYEKHVLDMIKKHHIGGVIFMRSDVATQCRQCGIHVNFAPVVDINSNPDNPIIKDRSFGADKENVTRKALQYMKRLHDAKAMAVAKHFPGHGDVMVDTHKTAGILPFSRQRLSEIELYPYRELISQGLGGIMTTHLVVNALDDKHPATLSPVVLTDLLRNELGFQGLIFADCMMMKAISQYYSPEGAAVRAFKAGVDVILMPVDLPRSISAIEDAIKKEPALEQKLDACALRILRAKEKFGLHEKRLVEGNVTAAALNKEIEAWG